MAPDPFSPGMPERREALADRSRRIGVIGAGRLGAALAIALDAAGYRVASIQRRRRRRLTGLAQWLPSAALADEPQAAADRCDVAFITTPDGVVHGVASQVRWRRDQWVLHCSGALGLDILAPASAAGASAGSLHPLQTFPLDYAAVNPWAGEAFPGEESESPSHSSGRREGADIGSGGVEVGSPVHPSERFRGVAMAVEADDAGLREWLLQVAGDLGGRPIQLRPGDRSAYHASAVMACGLTAALIGLAADMWSQFGIGREEALRALDPLIRTTVEGALRDGLPQALTGPLVRGDVETIRRHLAAAGRQSPEVKKAYAALALATLPMAAEGGHLSDEHRREIGRMLEHTLADKP